MPRLALIEPSMGSTTTYVELSPRAGRMPSSSEIEREIAASRVEARHHDALGLRVDRRRLVAAFALTDHACALDWIRHLPQHGLHVPDRTAAGREPVGHRGRNSRPDGSLG